MSGHLLDTNVVSELKKSNPSRKVVGFVAGLKLDQLYLSTVTLAEIRFGIERQTDMAKRSSLTVWLDTELRPMFEGRVLAADEDVLLKWRLIIEAGRRRGHTFSHPDVLIAATAAHHGLTVVTRDSSEFIAAGVAVHDPWTGQATPAAP